MEFKVLGPLQASDQGIPLELGEPQRRLVLALLLAGNGSVVSTDRLVDGVWGSHAPENGRKIVQGYISGLRKALGNADVIETRSPGYRLTIEAAQVDAWRFEQGTAQGVDQVASDPRGARRSLAEALTQWNGAPYEDLADFDALRPEITRLEQLHSAALEARIAADILCGNESAVNAELADLTRRFPLRERLWSLRMLALYRTGNQAEALRVFDEARVILAAEVGLEPSGELQRLQQRILDQDPALHTPSAFEPAAVVVLGRRRNPYKGLRAFEEVDAADFYGREAMVRRLREAVERRSATRLVILAGPSGSGKSSVVKAGLTPQLRADGWDIATTYPGGTPLESLAAAVDELAAHPRALLVIDQLEELITLSPDDVGQRFLDEIVDLATDPNGPWLLVTIRADFLDDLLVHPRFAPIVERCLLLITPLENHEVRDVIVGPASRVNLIVEPSLVTTLVGDVAARASALPLLEYTLADLFDRIGNSPMTLESLEAAGGMTGTLAKRAEDLFEGLTEAGRATARQVFLRLLTVSDEGEALRHRVTTESLTGLPEIENLLSDFGEHRLLTFDRDRDGKAVVEVAHEALFREWPRLVQWIDEARDSLRMLRRLTDAAGEWDENGRPDWYLFTSARLAQYVGWPDDELALSDTEQQFLEGSRDTEERERSRARRRRSAVVSGFATAAVIAASLATAAFVARNDAQDSADTARRNEALAISRELAASAVAVRGEDAELSILLALEAIDATPREVAASPAGVLALRESLQQQRLLARIPGDFAHVRMAPDGSTIYVASEPERLVMAVDASSGEVLWTFQDPAALDAVWSLFVLRLLSLEVSPDGSLLTVDVPDFPTNVDTFGIDPDPARVVVLDTSSGEVVHTLEFDECRISRAQRFTPDGKWLAVGTGTDACIAPEANWVDLYDPVTWQPGPRIQIEDINAENVTFSADGSRILVHDPTTNNAELRSFPELELINQLPANRARPLLSPSGTLTVVESPETDRRFLLVGADRGNRVAYLDVDDFDTGDGPEFSPDGSTVAVPTRTHDYVFDTRNGQLLVDLGNNGATNSLDFSADGSRLVTVGSEGAKVWDIEGRGSATGTALTVPRGVVNWVNPNAVVEGGALAVKVIIEDGASDALDPTMTLILDAETGSRIDIVPGDSLQLPDGRFVFGKRSLGTEDRPVGPLIVLDPESGLSTELDGCVAPLADLIAGTDVDCGGPFLSWYGLDRYNLVSSIDKSFFAATSYAPSGVDRMVRVWNSDDLEIRSEFSIPFVQLVFAAGPTWVAATNDPEFSVENLITIYDVDSGSVLSEFDGPVENLFITSTSAITNDGSMLLLPDDQGNVFAFETSTWEQVAQWRAHDAVVRGFAIAADGGRLATTGQDDLVNVWDIGGLIADGSLAGAPPLLDRVPADFPSDAAWLSPDRLGVFLADSTQYIQVNLNTDDLVTEAVGRLTRSFSIEECSLYQLDPCPTLDEIRERLLAPATER